MSVRERASGFDRQVAEIVNDLGTVLTIPFEVPAKIIDKLQNLPTEDRRHYRNDVPKLVDSAQKVWSAFRNYHQTILQNSSKWSDDVKYATGMCVKVLLYPLSCTHVGEALRVTMARDVLGNIMKAVSFVAFQIFHLIPCFLMVATFKAINMVYIRYPVALIAGIMTSMLFLQIYFIYRLVKEVEITNKIFEERTDLSWITNPPKRFVRWSVSWFPRSLISCCVSKDTKA